MKFDIITIFPKIFDSYLKESLMARAQKKRFIKVSVHNLRKWAKDRHKTATPAFATRKRCGRVDDRPFGGGLGMVFKIEPLFKAIKALKKKGTKVILFTPRGKQFDQKTAYKLAKAKHLIFICGRYEGVDERVAQHLVDEEISIGEYDLMGGELPAMVVIETIARLIPGVLGKPQLLKERITKNKGFIEYEQYTRPEVFKNWRVPKVLLSGDHKTIAEWRKKHQKAIE
ncbi:tRNA (guanosine(37)-N1)-methyltransferase TrmD [Candidatus Jorgensenbacteria bacterium GWC1_48_12]|uniref:tRNA (guanine-N(1)-)-methyltransferase n=1 Tax=Candidatus Jorgensenbacteria bacterium GWC1_48_12 TaxID=1798469 RepID=A0A1F6BPJ2_9BACT|nr:MAG: tRNA (guanosine(37)-N1)-methyltransferase TrmD [Candidatus Jorgensenbacteria bacterium GWC1_48_12]